MPSPQPRTYYNKPPLTFEEQAQRLQNRGLKVTNNDAFIDFLSNVNYYRFTGYLYHLRIKKDDELLEDYNSKADFDLIQS